MDIDRLFGGMAKAEIFGRGKNMAEGLYKVQIKNIFCKEGKNPRKPGDSFIVEFTILESSKPDAHAPGSSGSWVLKFTWPATFGHITRFVFAMLGWEPTDEALKNPRNRELAELYARAVCGSLAAKQQLGAEWEEGMFNGIQLGLETMLQSTDKGGNFTAYAWSPLQEAA